jgi:hypothetical protein
MVYLVSNIIKEEEQSIISQIPQLSKIQSCLRCRSGGVLNIPVIKGEIDTAKSFEFMSNK